MAERRMFAQTIVTSDAFLEMPASSRCLYFLLGMQADDDGFVNRPKAIMRESGACDDDLKLLIAKRFLIPFQSGVVVIKHWKIHNLIKNDRYKETKYLEEKSLLELDGNGAWTEKKEPVSNVDPKWIQDGSETEPQVRLVKDSLGELRIGKERGERTHERTHEENPPQVFNSYGEYANVMLTPDDEKKLSGLYPDDWVRAVEKMSRYMHDTGKEYANHMDVLLRWIAEDLAKGTQFPETAMYTERMRQKNWRAE